MQRADTPLLGSLIQRWRDDPGGTYQTWFLWDERLKNFRSIRRGLAQVVSEITAGSFGNAYKGSSLALGGCAGARELFLVAPDDREAEVRAQVRRPAFAHISDLHVCFLPYTELERHVRPSRASDLA